MSPTSILAPLLVASISFVFGTSCSDPQTKTTSPPPGEEIDEGLTTADSDPGESAEKSDHTATIVGSPSDPRTEGPEQRERGEPDRRGRTRTPVDRADVPTQVEDTFQVFLANEMPGLQITQLEFRTRGDREYYEFEMEDIDGRHVEIEVTPEGQIIELERELEPVAEKLPPEVRSTLDFYLSQMVDPQIAEIEYEDEEGDPIEYEIRLIDLDGNESRIDIGEDGAVLRERL